MVIHEIVFIFGIRQIVFLDGRGWLVRVGVSTLYS